MSGIFYFLTFFNSNFRFKSKSPAWQRRAFFDPAPTIIFGITVGAVGPKYRLGPLAICVAINAPLEVV